jgi:hypothetical protein
MMRRTKAPAGGEGCCFWAGTLPSQTFADLVEREGAGDEAAEAVLIEASNANIAIEDELAVILQAITDGEKPPALH